jgi:exopolysaccharide biosynthesis polyprenyl glycosylphosphotransferase
MLAVADVAAGITVSCSLALVHGHVVAAFWSLVFVPTWVVLAKLHGLYDRDQRVLRHLTVDELPALCAWQATGTVGLLLFLLATPAGSLGVETGLWVWAVGVGAAFMARGGARFAWRRATPPARTLIIGSGDVADAARRKLELFPDIHGDVVGQRPELTAEELAESREWLADVDQIIFAPHAIDGDVLEGLVALCRRARIRLALVPPVRGLFGTAVQLSHVAELPVIVYGTWDIPRSTLLLKRAIDVTVSAALLFALSPLLVAIACLVKLSSRGPVLFRQTRIGMNGRPFSMFKFRTMVVDAEVLLPTLVSIDDLHEPVFKLKGDPRVTRIGRLLRRTSLDELPQLWNVLRGEMSLVGPRPDLVEQAAHYTEHDRRRLGVKPGITGWSQVNGRDEIGWPERIEQDLWYIDHWSLALDARIVLATFAQLFRPEPQPVEDTMNIERRTRREQG